VEEKDRLAFAFVDEVDGVIAVSKYPAVEGKLPLEPGRERRWRKKFIHLDFS
jgi:hypothetical protein